MLWFHPVIGMSEADLCEILSRLFATVNFVVPPEFTQALKFYGNAKD